MLNRSLGTAVETPPLARALFSTGVVLLVGAATMFAYVGSRDVPRPVPEFSSTRPLPYLLPQAYDDWSRTDFIGREAALAALGRVSSDAGLEPPGGLDMMADDMALAVYSGEGGSFAILLARDGRPTDWSLPSGPVRVINGRLLEEKAVVENGLVDLRLRTRSGLTALIRGRAGTEVIEGVVLRLGDLVGA